jgi:hypothetical protein
MFHQTTARLLFPTVIGELDFTLARFIADLALFFGPFVEVVTDVDPHRIFVVVDLLSAQRRRRFPPPCACIGCPKADD